MTTYRDGQEVTDRQLYEETQRELVHLRDRWFAVRRETVTCKCGTAYQIKDVQVAHFGWDSIVFGGHGCSQECASKALRETMDAHAPKWSRDSNISWTFSSIGGDFNFGQATGDEVKWRREHLTERVRLFERAIERAPRDMEHYVKSLAEAQAALDAFEAEVAK